MFGRTVRLPSLLVLLWPVAFTGGFGQQQPPQQLDPKDTHLHYSFPIQPGATPFDFKVKLDKSSSVSGVAVFRRDSSDPFQTLPTCMPPPGDSLSESDEDLVLLKHADLNFDGFEDLELRVYRIDHLDKNVYCIYLWDSKAGRFTYSKELSDISTNIEAHPETKTITTHEDWQGGPWENDTYRWEKGTLELIEQASLLGDWSAQTDKQCGFTFTCSRLIKGHFNTTLAKPICKPEEMFNLPDCPGGSPPPHSATAQ